MGRPIRGAPDPQLLAFGSSLEEDLVLAPFDVECSLAHVAALVGGGIRRRVAGGDACGRAADACVARLPTARSRGWRARWIRGRARRDRRARSRACGRAGEWLHAGRSRNDQVATTLLSYVRDRARQRARRCAGDCGGDRVRARASELEAGTVLAGCTHRQPAQPVTAGVRAGRVERTVRARDRRASWRCAAPRRATSCPLGSAALAGSSLPLEREAAARRCTRLRRAVAQRARRDRQPRRGARSGARVRARDDRRVAHLRGTHRVVDARIRLRALGRCGGDRFELDAAEAQSRSVRTRARPRGDGDRERTPGALATLCGLAPSYQRDLQVTKQPDHRDRRGCAGARSSAFGRALRMRCTFAREHDGGRGARTDIPIATDVADALIARVRRRAPRTPSVGAAVARGGAGA